METRVTRCSSAVRRPTVALLLERQEHDRMTCETRLQTDIVQSAVVRFIAWLDRYGETSFDHQSYFAGPIGGRAKQLYYRKKFLGTLAVAPMILSEAFLPAGRKLFSRKQRFPIADAHYAMGFAMLARQTGESIHYDRAVRFLEVLEETRCPGYRHYCWGYPFDWVTRTGVMAAGTPLITTTPYVYEAFSYVHQIDGNRRWLDVMQSAAEHAATDIQDKALSTRSATAGYNPGDTQGGVVNASAYRAYLLTSAGRQFSRDRLPPDRGAQRKLRSGISAARWFVALRDGRRSGFRRSLPHVLRLEGAGQARAPVGSRRCPSRDRERVSTTTCGTFST